LVEKVFEYKLGHGVAKWWREKVTIMQCKKFPIACSLSSGTKFLHPPVLQVAEDKRGCRKEGLSGG
jgi:hypothetical protein